MSFEFDKIKGLTSTEMIADNYEESAVTYMNQLIADTIQSQMIRTSSFLKRDNDVFYYKDQKVYCRTSVLNLSWITSFFSLCEEIKAEHGIDIKNVLYSIHLDGIDYPVSFFSGIHIDIRFNNSSFILDTAPNGYTFNFDNFKTVCQYLNWFFYNNTGNIKGFTGLDIFTDPKYFTSQSNLIELLYMFAYDDDKDLSQICNTFQMDVYFSKLFLNTILSIFKINDSQALWRILNHYNIEKATLREGSIKLIKIATAFLNNYTIAAMTTDIDQIEPVDIETLIANIKE